MTGVIGTLMALEAIKMITGLSGELFAPISLLRLTASLIISLFDLLDPSTPPTLLIYSALSTPLFRSIKLRKRQPKCRACGQPDTEEGSTSSADSKIIDLTTEDYITFCGAEPVDWTEEGMRDSSVERVGVKVRQVNKSVWCMALAN